MGYRHKSSDVAYLELGTNHLDVSPVASDTRPVACLSKKRLTLASPVAASASHRVCLEDCYFDSSRSFVSGLDRSCLFHSAGLQVVWWEVHW